MGLWSFMEELINYAVTLMTEENLDAESNPTQNSELHPSQNTDINVSQNPNINPTQNSSLHWSQNPNWKSAWWAMFKETVLWEYLTDSQRKRCQSFLKQL